MESYDKKEEGRGRRKRRRDKGHCREKMKTDGKEGRGYGNERHKYGIEQSTIDIIS